MKISCLMVSHNKPQVCSEAMDSVLNQTHQDWELVLMDSGVLYDSGYFNKYSDPRIKLIRSDETEHMRRTKAMAPWCFNEMYRRGLIEGKAVVYLSDDDLWYSNAFEAISLFLESRDFVSCVYFSQDVGVIRPNGQRFIKGQRLTSGMKGKFCGGGRIDCVLDFMQFAVRSSLLDKVSWPESKATENHADGVFFEQVGSVTPIHPLPMVLSQNRRTPWSINDPSK